MLLANVEREDVCDMVLDDDTVNVFENAVDRQVNYNTKTSSISMLMICERNFMMY